MKRVHYAWIICLGCTLLLFCTIGLLSNSFAVYLPYIKAHAGLTNTQSSMIVTLRNLAALVAMLFVTRFYDKTNIRLGVFLSACLSATALLLFGLAGSFTMYGIAALVAGFAYALGGTIPVAIIINRWFSSHKALAISISSAGTGVASIAMPPIITSIIENSSLTVGFLSVACFAAVSSLLILFIIRNYPDDKGLQPLLSAKDTAQSKAILPGAQTSTGQHVVICISMLVIGAIGNAGFSHLSILYRTEGFNSFTVSMLLSIVGIALTASKFIYGYITDRFKTYRSNYIFSIFLFSGLVGNSMAGSLSAPMAYAVMAALGTGLPLCAVGPSLYANDFAQPESYATTIRLYQLSYMVGALVFSFVPGAIADRTGSYTAAYALLAVLFIFSMAAIQYVYRRQKNALQS